MKKKTLTNISLFLLSALFTAGLMFAFIELPPLADSFFGDKIGFPGFDQGASEMNAYKTELYIAASGLRIAGYISLAAIVVLIVAGFITKKTGWALGGAALAFLPVFGGFAISMFYLAGLGIFRTVLMPLTDISPALIQLGDIIYIPYWIIIRTGFLFGYFAHDLASWLFMVAGGLIFFLGVYGWVRARFSLTGVATGLVYRYSRHPQYLGWIIWSYGYFLYTFPLNNLKKSWGFIPTISWLIMTMVIIGVCMSEELKMKKLYGEAYSNYKEKTPFLFPVPGFLKRILKIPGRIIMRKKEPESGVDILKIITTYTLLLMLLSLPLIKVNNYELPSDRANSAIELPELDWLEEEISNETGSRRMSQLFDLVARYGEESEEMLTRIMHEGSDLALKYAPYSLSLIKTESSAMTLRNALGDTALNIDFRIINALGNQDLQGNGDAIYNYWLNASERPDLTYLVRALGNLKYEKGWELFTELFRNGQAWHQRVSGLNAMVNCNRERAMPFVYEALADPDPGVKRQAVQYLLEWQIPSSVSQLEKVRSDPDFETRFYARQAIKAILKHH